MTAITRKRLANLAPDEAAALWLVERDKGTPVEAGLFEEWLANSEANQAAWESVEAAWTLFDDSDDLEFAGLREAALAEASTPRPILAAYWRPIAASAAVVAAIAGGVQLLQVPAGPATQVASAESGASAERTYAAPRSGVKEFVLADGTRMTLDRNARVRVAFIADRRKVSLDQGNVLFAVQHDATRPFSVAARDRTIVDVGTRFEVALDDTATRVMLYEGSVRIDGSPGGATLLRPGQELISRPDKGDIVIAMAGGGEALWREGLVQFDNVTLADAAETIDQGSAEKLVIKDPAVAGLRVSGRFRVRDPERFAQAVSELLSLRVVRGSRGTIELRKRR